MTRSTLLELPAPRADKETVGGHENVAAMENQEFETVLVVEDEYAVRDVIRRILEWNGYTVLEARDPAGALRLSETHDAPIDLLLTDVVMPEMSGRELAQRILVSRPETRLLYMSGYRDEALGRGVLPDGGVFIEKPFTAAALTAKVREVLDAPRRLAARG